MVRIKIGFDLCTFAEFTWNQPAQILNINYTLLPSDRKIVTTFALLFDTIDIASTAADHEL